MAETRMVLFIHGGGESGYETDETLATSLQNALGAAYKVLYPRMPNENTPDFGWGAEIGKELAAINDDVILVGHSLGASMLLKYLSENQPTHSIRGIFLISTPFWSGDEDWQKQLSLGEDFVEKLPKNVPIFLYHSRDDEEVDFSHLRIYADKLPQATIYAAESGGHQFGNNLSQVAKDIQALG